MNVLVVGGGGREHALIWKIAQSPRVKRLFCAPGNPGISTIAKNVDIPVHQIEALCAFACRESIDLTVVGPEIPLSLGIVDLFEQGGLRIFGPRRMAAEIETSKGFSKRLMQKYGIPTARAEIVPLSEVEGHLVSRSFPVVLKADGLAAGKGVIIVNHRAEGTAAVEALASLGASAQQILVEDFLEGTEVSFFILTDGHMACPLTTAQDYKRLKDNHQGPNTGGMGAISPSPVMTQKLVQIVMETIIKPMLAAMSAEGRPYQGVLYAGLMLTPAGPAVLEWNARWGDPEAQVILPRLEGDLIPMMEAVIDQRLDQMAFSWKSDIAACVVLAARGYPDQTCTGDVITGFDAVAAMSEKDHAILFHAGTQREGDVTRTSGGRVLGITALGQTLADARRKAYAALPLISFEGMQFRHDIGACPMGS